MGENGSVGPGPGEGTDHLAAYRALGPGAVTQALETFGPGFVAPPDVVNLVTEGITITRSARAAFMQGVRADPRMRGAPGDRWVLTHEARPPHKQPQSAEDSEQEAKAFEAQIKAFETAEENRVRGLMKGAEWPTGFISIKGLAVALQERGGRRVTGSAILKCLELLEAEGRLIKRQDDTFKIVTASEILTVKLRSIPTSTRGHGHRRRPDTR